MCEFSAEYEVILLMQHGKRENASKKKFNHQLVDVFEKCSICIAIRQYKNIVVLVFWRKSNCCTHLNLSMCS